MTVGSPTIFFAGMLAMGFLVIGAVFLRFWRRTQDALFLAFAGAFALLAAGQAALALGVQPHDDQASVLLFRLGAFGLILVAIITKNLSSGRH
jgi:uncharacterized membrane protein HdeD (DUF308 family)